ncbi:hypothetical protein EGR_10744 [Echinococcus granulosus]|uniref:Uncharacterized protein n=1 Tax=Echinococcus granulosus TaxID=6210 RepID=W6U1I5_ECHGR|nr:hypothetical protein EGR_10744 [Echinococcus granulosus]EUB54401.1 hypothetical protein EGR_10744 [Echinococcus granulosus]
MNVLQLKYLNPSCGILLRRQSSGKMHSLDFDFSLQGGWFYLGTLSRFLGLNHRNSPQSDCVNLS